MHWHTRSALVLLVALAGCAQLEMPKSWTLPGWDSKPQGPTRMTDVWTDTVLHQPGLPGVRGFGGRIMFYNDEDKKSIKVEGTLTVYAFDAQADPLRTTPERKFVFPAEELGKHYSKSKLGHSYNFWLPFDEVGGPQRQYSLITRFEAATGEAILSNPTRQTLPGMLSASSPLWKKQPSNSVRSVSHEAAEAQPGPAMSTVTIDVPPSFAQQGRALPDPAAAAAESQTPQTAPSDQATVGAQAATGSSPATGFAPRRFPVRKGPAAPPRRDPDRRQPLPATSPAALPPTPRAESAAEATRPSISAEPPSN